MGLKWLISGPPGCGKTTWILNKINNFNEQCGYLSLAGETEKGLEPAPINSIDRIWLKDQIPNLIDLSDSKIDFSSKLDSLHVMIEFQKFKGNKQNNSNEFDWSLNNKLAAMRINVDRIMYFGQDADLPKNDTLEFKSLQTLYLNLSNNVWDINSLSSFWFELVNGAYGDVYRAKGLMNLPDGRSFFCNWIVSQEGSQFLPLNYIAPPTGRPNRISELIVQGIGLNSLEIQSTINDCLLCDVSLEMQQRPYIESNLEPIVNN